MMEFVLENFDTIFRNRKPLDSLEKMMLDLAVRGKLVPQNPKDEPANELLKKIREEKDRLVAEKAIKKEKGLAKIEDSEIPFEIPENWEWVRLGEVVKIINGATFDKKVMKYQKENNYTFIIRGGNLQKDNFLNSHDDTYIPFNFVSNEQLLIKGDTLMVSSSGTLTSVGKSIYLEKDMPETTVGAFLLILRPNIFESSKFLHFYLKIIRDKIILDLKGTSISNIKKTVIENYLVAFPPLAEQERIVEKVDSLMKVCGLLESKIEVAEGISKKLLESLLK